MGRLEGELVDAGVEVVRGRCSDAGVGVEADLGSILAVKLLALVLPPSVAARPTPRYLLRALSPESRRLGPHRHGVLWWRARYHDGKGTPLFQPRTLPLPAN